MITILDGNNFFRRLISVGTDARSILNSYFNPRNETIVVWDGERGSQRRRKVYPQYKTNRGPLDKDISVQFGVIVRVLSHCNVSQILHQDYEGDDLVAMLARDYAAQGHRVHIDSTDADFLQLVADYPQLITTVATGKTTPELTKLYKIWVGDTSDKISGIPLFGQKTWEATNLNDLQRLTDVALTTGQIIDIGLPKSVKPTADLLRALNEIVSFYPVPIDEAMKNLVLGRRDYEAADAFLKELFI